jgi:hypothetical protein
MRNLVLFGNLVSFQKPFRANVVGRGVISLDEKKETLAQTAGAST